MKANAYIVFVVSQVVFYSASVTVTTPVVVFSDQLPSVVVAPVVTALQAEDETVGVQVIAPNIFAVCRLASMFS